MHEDFCGKRGITMLEFVTMERLLEMKENNEEFTLVEALPEKNYKEGHIPGAVNVPPDQVDEKASELDKDKLVIVYCASYKCPASTKVVRKLQELGFKKVLDFKAGKQAWINAELELEK